MDTLCNDLERYQTHFLKEPSDDCMSQIHSCIHKFKDQESECWVPIILKEKFLYKLVYKLKIDSNDNFDKLIYKSIEILVTATDSSKRFTKELIKLDLFQECLCRLITKYSIFEKGCLKDLFMLVNNICYQSGPSYFQHINAAKFLLEFVENEDFKFNAVSVLIQLNPETSRQQFDDVISVVVESGLNMMDECMKKSNLCYGGMNLSEIMEHLIIYMKCKGSLMKLSKDFNLLFNLVAIFNETKFEKFRALGWKLAKGIYTSKQLEALSDKTKIRKVTYDELSLF